MITYNKKDIPSHLQKYFEPAELGLEPTFQGYINKLCDIFDEVKRVLRKDGTCWVVIGDTYSATRWSTSSGTSFMAKNNKNNIYGEIFQKNTDLPDKCLLQIPSRFSIEMCNRGWILRNTIIWHKPNCMPSSIKDRFTVDFEYIFFFVKNKKYCFETQYEPHKNTIDVEYRKKLRSGKQYNTKEPYKNNIPYSVQPRNKETVDYRNLPDLKEFAAYLNINRQKAKLSMEKIEEIMGSQAPHHWFGAESYPSKDDYIALKKIINLDNKYDKEITEVFTKSSEKTTSNKGRNKRTVWKINTKPFKGAHFAVFPEELIDAPIKAGCPKGGTVLDCFCGSGTSGVVAQRQEKDFIGIELNPEYIKIAEKRLDKGKTIWG